LVNNAGVSLWGPMECCPLDDIERVIATNLLGPIMMANAVLPGMRARGRGKIIQISSAAARNPNPLLGAYAASKSGLEAMSWCLRVELSQFAIPVTVVSMSAIETGMDVNRKVIDVADTAYGDLQRRTLARTARIRAAPAPADDVAKVVQGVVDDPSPPFMVYVGEELRAAMARKAGLSDAQVEAEVLASLRD
jgi:NAD(P)-dependent dehydrogenase (short-subunit alcohol dehydrogenase family)